MIWKRPLKVELETPRFRLVSVSRRALVRASLPWTDDADFMGAQEMRAGGWLKRRWRRRFPRFDGRRAICFGMFEKGGDGSLIGYHTVQISGDVGFLGVGVGDKKWWGQGAVAETRAEVIRYLFAERQLARVWGTPYGRNLASIYNYQRLGFVYEGAMRQHRASLDGKRIDMPVFGLLRSEWQARQEARRAAGKMEP